MKIILGTPGAYKTTCLLSLAYSKIDKWIEERKEQEEKKTIVNDEPLPYAVFITSKKKLNENQLIFGTYSEVTIDVLKNIHMKYIDSFDNLVHYLMDFHLLEQKPSIVIIDGMELYCTGSCERKLSQVTTATKKCKADYLINLIKHVECLYSKSKNSVCFIVGQRIFSTIPDGSMASKEVLSGSASEFTFLSSLYSRHSSDLYLVLTSPNAGGPVLQFDESEDEGEGVVIKSKSDPDGVTHIADAIFSAYSVGQAEKECDWIKTKLVSLYKYVTKDVLEGGDGTMALVRCEQGDEADCITILRDHVLGDVRVEYDAKMDLQVNQPNDNQGDADDMQVDPDHQPDQLNKDDHDQMDEDNKEKSQHEPDEEAKSEGEVEEVAKPEPKKPHKDKSKNKEKTQKSKAAEEQVSDGSDLEGNDSTTKEVESKAEPESKKSNKERKKKKTETKKSTKV